MIQIFYGTSYYKINITQTFINNFIKNNLVVIPKDTSFNNYFGDPVPDKLKIIIIKDSGGEYVINEYDTTSEIRFFIKTVTKKREIHFITYANHILENSANKLCQEAVNYGEFSKITKYNPNMITSNFKKKYKDILERPRGGGYWIWKWNIIKQKLDEINYEDYIIYLDAGCSFNNNSKGRFNEYIELLENSNYGLISFKMKDCQEKQWTIKQIFENLNIDINSEFANSGQYCGGILIIKKNKHSINIINKCLELLDFDNLLVTDDYNHTNQETFFLENRHDQSILSIIRKIYGSVVIDDEVGGYSIDTINYANNPPFLALRKQN